MWTFIWWDEREIIYAAYCSVTWAHHDTEYCNVLIESFIILKHWNGIPILTYKCIIIRKRHKIRMIKKFLINFIKHTHISSDLINTSHLISCCKGQWQHASKLKFYHFLSSCSHFHVLMVDASEFMT